MHEGRQHLHRPTLRIEPLATGLGVDSDRQWRVGRERLLHPNQKRLGKIGQRAVGQARLIVVA